MALQLLVFYGSYRANRAGIRLADYMVARLAARGHAVELIDARAVGLPMLDKRLSDHGEGEAPEAMTRLADKIISADGFVFVAGEYNWGIQPGLKNLVDHFFTEWFHRPAGIVSYSAGRLGGARSNSSWHATLTELGMLVVPSTITVGGITASLDESGQPIGEGGTALERSFPRFAETLEWWAQAAKDRRAHTPPPG